jgi:hypothetical protein
MIPIRHAGRFTLVMLQWAWRSGQWWMPLLVLGLGVAAALAGTAQTVAPTLFYALF